MNHAQYPGSAVDHMDDDELAAIYGSQQDDVEARTEAAKKTEFQPWHHPAKQFVRREQWIRQARRLLNGSARRRVRYLTLPGADMMDVRLLGEFLKDEGHTLECLGFNSRQESANSGDAASASQVNAESILRQQGFITSNSITLPDRIQDIVVSSSQADSQLRMWGPFDIVNMDLCSHFAGDPGTPSVFDAVARIVGHQRSSSRPWLLMLTTRVHPDHLGEVPKAAFSTAIRRNIALGATFTDALANALEIGLQNVEATVEQSWLQHDLRFVKLYTIGLGKHLLHLLHNQYQDPARVELKSCLAYRVHGQVPDMLSLAFLIAPAEKRLVPADAGNALPLPPVEVVHANQIARKAGTLGDVDRLLEDIGTLNGLVAESEQLLTRCNYDISRYREWLETHPERPVLAGETVPVTGA